MNQEQEKTLRGRLVLLAIVAIFIIPFGISYYYFQQARQGATWGMTNNGLLISPAQPLQEFSLGQVNDKKIGINDVRGKWTLLYAPAMPCDKACKKNIFNMRQVWALLSKEAYRVQRILVLPDVSGIDDMTVFLNNYERMHVSADPNNSLLKQLPTIAGVEEPLIFLIDPIGNLMMAFPQSLDSAKILSDIKKLLKISQVG